MCFTSVASCHALAASAQVIAHKSSATRGEMLVNPAAWDDFQALKGINIHARGRHELFSAPKVASSR